MPTYTSDVDPYRRHRQLDSLGKLIQGVVEGRRGKRAEQDRRDDESIARIASIIGEGGTDSPMLGQLVGSIQSPEKKAYAQEVIRLSNRPDPAKDLLRQQNELKSRAAQAQLSYLDQVRRRSTPGPAGYGPTMPTDAAAQRAFEAISPAQQMLMNLAGITPEAMTNKGPLGLPKGVDLGQSASDMLAVEKGLVGGETAETIRMQGGHALTEQQKGAAARERERIAISQTNADLAAGRLKLSRARYASAQGAGQGELGVGEYKKQRQKEIVSGSVDAIREWKEFTKSDEYNPLEHGTEAPKKVSAHEARQRAEVEFKILAKAPDARQEEVAAAVAEVRQLRRPDGALLPNSLVEKMDQWLLAAFERGQSKDEAMATLLQVLAAKGHIENPL